jgi:hypothetical protein
MRTVAAANCRTLQVSKDQPLENQAAYAIMSLKMNSATGGGSAGLNENRTADAMVPVHVCWTDAEAGVVVSYLAAHGITSVVGASMPRSIYPLTVDGMGQITLEVERSKAEEARALLAAREKDAESPEDSP